MRPSEYAVSHYDYTSGTWRTAAGHFSQSPEEETVLILDSLAEAERYCRGYVEEHPSLYCKIFDRDATDQNPVQVIYHPKTAAKIQGLPAARKQLGLGVLLLSTAALCVAVDLKITGTLILGAVVGSKFLVSGVVKLVSGIGGVLDNRKRSI